MARQETLAVKAILESNGFDQGLKKVSDGISKNKLEYENARAKAEAYGTATDQLKAKQTQLTSNIDLQRQKLQMLERALEQAKQQHGENSAVTEQFARDVTQADTQLSRYVSQLNRTEAQLRDVAAAENTTGNEAQKMGGNIQSAGNKAGGFKAQVKEFASSSVGQFATVAGAVGLITKALDLAAQAVKATFEKFVNAADWADELITLSNQTGITTDTLQGMAYAARFVDVEMEVMQKGLQRVVRAYSEASAAGQDYIQISDGLKVSINDANDDVKTSEQLFYDTVDALGSMASATEREAAAQEIFGKSYQEIMPLVRAGSGALKDYTEQAKETGNVIDEGLVKVLGKLDDQMEETEAATKSAKRMFAATHTEVGKFMNTVKFATDNLFEITTLLYEKAPKAIAGMSTEQIIYEDKMKAGAAALGISYEDFVNKVTDLQAQLAASGMESAEAQAEAFNLVVDGIAAQTWAMDQLEAKNDEYDEAIQKSFDKYQSLLNEYEAAVPALTEKILSASGGLFAAFPRQLDESGHLVKKSGETLIGNLRSQNTGLKEWSNDLKSLAAKGVDEGLLAKLHEAGPAAADEVSALNDLTGPRLDEYVRLWKENSELATTEAKTALAPMKANVDAALSATEKALRDKQQGMYELGKTLGDKITGGADAALRKLADKVEAKVRAAIAAGIRAAGGYKYSTGYSESGIYGNGGIVSTPHRAIVGDVPEVIVPLNRKQRSMELLDYANRAIGGGSGSGGGTVYSPNISINVLGDANDPFRLAHEVELVEREMAMRFNPL